MARVSKSELESAVARARRVTGLPIIVERAYGAPRLYLEGPGSGVRELSPRMPPAALVIWLHAFLDGFAYGKRSR